MKVFINRKLTEQIGKNYELVDKREDCICDEVESVFYFGTVQECSREKTFNVSFYDLSVTEFLPFLKEEYFNFEGYFKQCCQVTEKEIGKFCRSNSGNKVFSGQILNDIYSLKLMKEKLQEDDLLYFSDVKEICNEWRFWIIEEEIVGYSEYENPFVIYSENSNIEIKDIFDYVKKMNSFWTPSDCFTMDICYSNNKFYVIEYNCFSSSGFYSANIENIVKNLKKYLKLN